MVIGVVFAQGICVGAHGLALVAFTVAWEVGFCVYLYVFPIWHYLRAYGILCC